MPSTIHLSRAVLDGLIFRAARAKPEECCGVLLGKVREADAYVEQVLPADNIAESDRRRAYQVDWSTLLEAIGQVRRGRQQLIGFYHSHPTGSTEPSESDRRDAWADCSYLIIAGRSGVEANVASWRRPRHGGPWERERIAVG